MTAPTCSACGIELIAGEDSQRWCLICAARRGVVRGCAYDVQLQTAMAERCIHTPPWARWTAWLSIAIEQEQFVARLAPRDGLTSVPDAPAAAFPASTPA